MRRGYAVRTGLLLLAYLGVIVLTPVDDEGRSLALACAAAVAMVVAYVVGRIEGSKG